MKLTDIVDAPEPQPSKLDGKKIYQQEFGRRLRKLRKLLGYTQEQLAHIAAVDRTTVTNIEIGYQAISIHTFVALCQNEKLAADIVIWLLTGNERPDLGASAFGCPVMNETPTAGGNDGE